ncbi:MAG: hypothetical protein ABS46_14220 [Cytophagaceae bacterium SCN 52-12]|nr:MAG: hypothetical protein ABS46_14220 [Cytophagaceae bacterium SCN 52-12]
MAKKETGLKSTLSLGPKFQVPQTTVDIEKTELATKKIHAPVSRKEGKWFRVTTDLPEDEYIRFKTKLIQEGRVRKGQDVVRELIAQYLDGQ